VSRRRLRLREIPRKTNRTLLTGCALRSIAFVALGVPMARPPILEGLPQALARLLSDLALLGDVVEREDHLPPDQQEDWQSAEAAIGRRGQPARRSRPPTRARATRSTRASTSGSKMKRSRRSRSRAIIRSRSTALCRRPKSTSATSTALITSSRTTRPAWTLLP